MSLPQLPDTVENRAMLILTAHQRRDVGCCLCDPDQPGLGRSHPMHQVQMLAEAGLLVQEVPR